MLMTLIAFTGLFVFAISGGIAAARAQMDIFGAIVLGCLTAIGGGSLRDLILDVPVFWLDGQWLLVPALIGSVIGYRFADAAFRMKPLIWADALGMAIFASLGAAKAAALGHGLIVTVICGTMTATAGGLARDVICNQVPLILREDVYALAAVTGSATLWIMLEFDAVRPFALFTAMGVCLVLRTLAIVFNWSLPVRGARSLG